MGTKQSLPSDVDIGDLKRGDMVQLDDGRFFAVDYIGVETVTLVGVEMYRSGNKTDDGELGLPHDVFIDKLEHVMGYLEQNEPSNPVMSLFGDSRHKLVPPRDALFEEEIEHKIVQTGWKVNCNVQLDSGEEKTVRGAFTYDAIFEDEEEVLDKAREDANSMMDAHDHISLGRHTFNTDAIECIEVYGARDEAKSIPADEYDPSDGPVVETYTETVDTREQDDEGDE